jgi:hypothetical protein
MTKRKPFRQFKDYGEIGTAEWPPRLAQSQAENGEAPVPYLPTYDQLLRCYAAACDALDFAHSEGFEWPHDPFGEIAFAFADVDRATWRLEQVWNAPASAIEAATAGETTKIGSTEGESAAREAGDAQP